MKQSSGLDERERLFEASVLAGASCARQEVIGDAVALLEYGSVACRQQQDELLVLLLEHGLASVLLGRLREQLVYRIDMRIDSNVVAARCQRRLPGQAFARSLQVLELEQRCVFE